MPKLRRAGFFCELPHGDADGPTLRAAISPTAAEDEERTVEYLRSGAVLIGTPGIARDVLDETRVAGAPHVLTDGTWAWPGDLAYYVATYHARVDDAFVEHMRRRGWRPPQEEELDLLALEL